MIEGILLASDGRGVRMTVAAAESIASAQEPAEVGRVSGAVITRAGCPDMVVREPGFRV